MASLRLFIAVVVAAFGTSGCATANPAVADTATTVNSTRHQILGPLGQPIGWGERHERRLPNGGWQTESRRNLRVRESGTRTQALLQTDVLERDAEGRTVRVERQLVSGRVRARTSASVADGRAVVSREVLGDVREVTLTLPAETVFDQGAALLRAWDSATSLNQEFHILDLDAPAVRRVTLVELPESTQSLRRFERRVFAEPGASSVLLSVTRFQIDPQTRDLRSEQLSFGGVLAVQSDDGELGRASGMSSSSLLRQMLLRSPVRIPRAARGAHLRFELDYLRWPPSQESKTTRGGAGLSRALPGPQRETVAPEESAIARFLLPATGEQRIQYSQQGLTVDVCLDCGSGLSGDQQMRADALKPTFWLQSDHPRVQKAAARAIRWAQSDEARMRSLVNVARRTIRRVDFAGHFSALSTLRRRAGDCTESAVLLAGLARSAGIAAKVASGVVYSSETYHGVAHAFMPHAWVVAYVDGRWRSYDAALDGFDATHVAFSISDGDPSAIAAGHRMAGMVQWRGISEVRQR